MNETINKTETNKEDGSTKKKKKPKISKAEKRRLKLLAAMDLKKRLMKEQLLRELELTKNSSKQGKLKWEEICKDIKVKEFREEIQEWSEKTERILQKKDEKIDMLMKNIEETQEMHERNFCQHLDQLEYLTNCHQTLRETATELYNMQASDLIQDFFDEISGIQEVQEKTKLNIENIMHTTNIDVKKRLRENYELYMERNFDEVTSEIETRYILRDRTVQKMNDLQKQLLNWVKDLQGDLVDVRKTENFLNFMQRQKNYVVEAKRLNEIERSSQKTISELQQELLHIEAESNRKVYGLKLEQAYFLNVRSIIKSSIERDKILTHEKMLKVSSESYEVIKKLKERVNYGELLLKLAACCRKYQTEKEKVIPFQYSQEEDEEEARLNMNSDIAKLLDISEEELTDEMNIMKNFWRRCSDVRYHNLLLKKDQAKLTEENEKYRNIIRSMKKSGDVQDILQALKIKQV
ncbi:dynein regulatory complex subunit 2 [Episyrphus balteatus]|uniref:dynein regulatory complex subunit 2 n=1 Tax=Episyrphus balteatus TaxID=286459 RepID=UPI0024862CF0|nr:dynein regulatory complex subunit 2 [Episyrphus balteatus]